MAREVGMKKHFLLGGACFLAVLILCIASISTRAGSAARPAPMMSAALVLGEQVPVNRAGGLLERTAGGHIIGFGAREVVFGSADHALRLEFVGSRGVTPESAEAQTAARSRAPALGKVIYRDLWPGITLAYQGEKSGVAKSVWTVGPGAAVDSIRLRANTQVSVDERGNLVYTLAQGTMLESKPVAWQDIGGKRVPVDVTYRLDGEREFGFAAAAFDSRYPLVIDPILSWNTFIGGTADDLAFSLALDSNGNIYVVGSSMASWGTPVRAYSGGYDCFVAKLGSNGTLLWNTFLGGPGTTDLGMAIGVDTWGDIYVCGESYDTWGSPVRAFSAARDEFVAKLSPGGELIWSTFLGGAGDDANNSMAVFPNGDCYVVGSSTASWGSPVRSFSTKEHYWDLSRDMSIAKVGCDGVLQWNTFLGGTSDDSAGSVALDNDGGVYVAGRSNSSWGNPIIPFPSSGHLDEKAAVAKLNAGGSLIWNTFFRQFFGQHECSGITVSPQNLLVVVGKSTSAWGTPINPYAGGPSDGFVAALDLDGNFVWNTFLGGPGGVLFGDECTSVAASEAGSIYVCGYSNASWGSPDKPFGGGGSDGFVVRLNRSGVLQALTFVGGASNDSCTALALDKNRNFYVAGYSRAPFGNPIRNFSLGSDVFVSKLTFIPDVLNRVAVGKFDYGVTGAVMSFPGRGVWKYSAGAWTQLSPDYAEELVAADVDGDLVDEVVGDFGALGLWLRKGGTWTQLRPDDAEYITAYNIDNDNGDELFCDFGTLGLWFWNDGAWSQLSTSNPDYIVPQYLLSPDHSSLDQINADFGAAGLWYRVMYDAHGAPSASWFQLSDRNPDFFACPFLNDIFADFGSQGLWVLGGPGTWTQLSAVDPEYMIGGSFDASGFDEIIADFGPVGLWLWNGSAWTQLSGQREEYMIAAYTRPGYGGEAFIDFGPLGLWEYNNGTWTQLTGVDPEYMTSGDFDGDSYDELMVDFGKLGLWMWDNGTWTQLAGLNPG
jgi:hypothetical protein